MFQLTDDFAQTTMGVNTMLQSNDKPETIAHVGYICLNATRDTTNQWRRYRHCNVYIFRSNSSAVWKILIHDLILLIGPLEKRNTQTSARVNNSLYI